MHIERAVSRRARGIWIVREVLMDRHAVAVQETPGGRYATHRAGLHASTCTSGLLLHQSTASAIDAAKSRRGAQPTSFFKR